jgi:hypothetical protein
MIMSSRIYIDDVPHAKFDAHGNYLHQTVATHLVQPEPEFFGVQEFLAFDDIIDDIVDTEPITC